ncbi:MAG: glycosyltransferase [Chromatiales bacterium]|nr:glycosyltransferase [Chromatiales bacterium]
MLFEPQFYPYLEHLQPCDVVFHAYDDFTGQSGWNDSMAAQQIALLKAAKLVTASSDAIARRLGDQRVRVLPNGADVTTFELARKRPEPLDLRHVPHPRIGYVGAINRKVDLKLIADVAAARPDWHWVLVGRVERPELLRDAVLADPLQRCEVLPNVHFLGQKDRLAVPGYVGHMDVNAMCYRTGGDGWWKAGYPLKMHEYLATGLPVISTSVESVVPFGHVVTLADSVDEWVSAIDDTHNHPDAEQERMRMVVAKENSWDARVDVLESLLSSL